MIGRLLMTLGVALTLIGCPQPAPAPLDLGGSIDPDEMRRALRPFAAMRAAAVGEEVVLEGSVGKVCPAGCWFYLHSAEDMLYVDVLGDFKVPADAQGRMAMVRGVVEGEGGSRILKAQRVRLSAHPELR